MATVMEAMETAEDLVPELGGRVRHKNLADALAAAQGEFPELRKSKTAKVDTKAGGSYSYSYADLADVYACVRPALSRHGLALSTTLHPSDGEWTVLRTSLLHADSGESLVSEALLPTLLAPQAFASNLTYFTRYTTTGIVGLAGMDDDDGEGANNETLRTMAAERGRNRPVETRSERPTPRGASDPAPRGKTDKGKTEVAPAADSTELLARIKRECVNVSPTLDAEAAHWRVLEWIYGTAQSDRLIPIVDHEVEWPEIIAAVWELYTRNRADYQSCLSRSLAELKRVGLN